MCVRNAYVCSLGLDFSGAGDNFGIKGIDCYLGLCTGGLVWKALLVDGWDFFFVPFSFFGVFYVG